MVGPCSRVIRGLDDISCTQYPPCLDFSAVMLFGGDDVLSPRDITSHSPLQPGVAPLCYCFLINETSAKTLYGSSKKGGERKAAWIGVGAICPSLFLLSVREMIWMDSKRVHGSRFSLKISSHAHPNRKIQNIWIPSKWEVCLQTSRAYLQTSCICKTESRTFRF